MARYPLGRFKAGYPKGGRWDWRRQDAAMRYTVHAELGQAPIDYELDTAIQAIREAWRLMGRGGKRVHIYDDDLDVVYWPHEFCELHRVTMAEAAARERPERRWFRSPHKHSK